VLGGALVVRSQPLLEKLYWFQNSAGGVPSPFDCYLMIRGVRTLGVRVRQHAENAQRVADFLQGHRKIARTFYPGLPAHPGHAIARRQMDGFGGMVSAEVAGGRASAIRVARRLKVFTLGESLGGVESLVNHPALMTHRAMPTAEQREKGISGGLLRLSVGIEDADDLIDDLRQALG
jgi:cystathionine gamma-lyase